MKWLGGERCCVGTRRLWRGDFKKKGLRGGLVMKLLKTFRDRWRKVSFRFVRNGKFDEL
jgi:hypothetical protein